jgi:protoporphyrin/coproporphyrin ferrochelatase
VSERLGVLVMAYGTPRSIEDIESYYTDIRGGRPPPPELLEELTGRYRAIGGRSPLLEITRAQAQGISGRLGIPAYLGQKHAAPFVADALALMAGDGIERAAGLVLAPHYSSMSVGDYARRAEVAAESAGWEGKLEMIESWHLEPGYLDLLTARVGDALGGLEEGARDRATVVFTAHSLPERILAASDPYADQLQQTAEAVAGKAGLEHWRIAWQSAGRTEDPWLGPGVLEVIAELAEAGAPAVVVCPCGFVSDHLEVLYDIDIEAAGLAAQLGIGLVRTASPNVDPDFLDMLAEVVRRALNPP